MEPLSQFRRQIVRLLLSTVTRKARGDNKPWTAVLGHRIAVSVSIGRLPAFIRYTWRTCLCRFICRARVAPSCARVSRPRTAARRHKLFPDLTADRHRIKKRRRQQHDPDKLSNPRSHDCAPLDPNRTSAEPRRTFIFEYHSARGISCQIGENCSKRPDNRPYEFRPEPMQCRDSLAKMGGLTKCCQRRPFQELMSAYE